MRKLICSTAVLLILVLGCRTDPPETHTIPTRAASLPVDAPEPDSTTRHVFEKVMAFARTERLHERSFGEIMQSVGLQFVRAPYVGGKLDVPEKETLIVDLTEFDCVLFVEAVLALARGIAVEDYRYETFVGHLLDQRYRGGSMNGYCSRLHYFSEWIADNEVRGIVENITAALGGDIQDKRLTFMSENRDKYPRFAENDSLFQGIREMEHQLKDLTLYNIPQDRIRAVYDRLRPGDIIATATHIEGLDVTHSGLAYAHEDGTIGFLHASTSGGVKVSPDLQSYVENNSMQIGIVVARPTDPRK
ncbi:MAG: N-acetylmuramoyl-L-alanine amidase-like domain-containing protein [Rhodothermales bacterium]